MIEFGAKLRIKFANSVVARDFAKRPKKPLNWGY